jgi:hypothetical protein
MENMKFTQKYLFYRKSIELLDSELIYETGNLLDKRSISIPYEEVLIERVVKNTITSKFYFFVSLISLSVMLKSLIPEFNFALFLLSLIFLIVFTLTTFITRRKTVEIFTHQYGTIELFDDNPSEAELKSFLESAKNKIFDFLKSRFLNKNIEMPHDEKLQILIDHSKAC